MYKGLKAQGMEYISVNQGDSAEVINKYVKEGKFNFPIVMDKKGADIAKMYGVMAYPTNYIIKDGKVVARFVGFDEKAMKDALTKLGFKVD
jgi:thioredoxin-like negative regulator of GroEL